MIGLRGKLVDGERKGWDVPNARSGCSFGKWLQKVWGDVIPRHASVAKRFCRLHRGRSWNKFLNVAAEMLDGALPCRQGSVQPHLEGDVARHGKPRLASRRHHRRV